MSARKSGNPTEDEAAASVEGSEKIEESEESLSRASSRLVSNIKELGVILVAFSLVASTCKHLAVSIETGYPLYLASYSYQDIFPSIPSALIGLAAALACLYCIYPALTIIINESTISGSNSDEKKENKTGAHEQGGQGVQRIATCIGFLLGIVCGLLAVFWLCARGLMSIYDWAKDTFREVDPTYVDVIFVVVIIVLSILIFSFFCFIARRILNPSKGKGRTPTGNKGPKFGMCKITKNKIEMICAK